MTASTTTRGRGLPRKQPENPDCEVASKGYVKCVARKLVDGPIDKALGMLTSAICWGVVVVVFMFASGLGGNLFGDWGFVTGMFWVSFALMVHDVIAGILVFSDSVNYDYIQKYEPPCEPKRGCEERDG